MTIRPLQKPAMPLQNPQGNPFRTLADAFPLAVMIHWKDTILYANPEAALLLGADSPADLTGGSPLKMAHPAEKQSLIRRFSKMLAGREVPEHNRFQGIKQDGTPIRLESLDRLIEWDGHPAVYTTLHPAGSDHKLVPDPLSVASLRMMFNSMPVPFIVLDRDFNLQLTNNKLLQVFDIPPELGRAGTPLQQILDVWHANNNLSPEGGSPAKDLELAFWNEIRERNHTYHATFEYRSHNNEVFEVRGAPMGEGGSIIMLTEISKRKQAEDALQESQKTLMALMSDLMGMAFRGEHTLERTMEFVSAGCLGLTGYQPFDLIMNIRVPYGYLIHPEDRKRVYTQIEGSAQHQTPYLVEYRIISASGEEKWVMESGRVLPPQKEEGYRLEGFVSDITSRKQMESQMQKSMELAENTTRAKSDFLAMMSHEIRTPMNAILGMAELLKETKLDQEQKWFLDSLESAGTNLMGLLNDILDLSKVEAGRIDLESVEFNLRQVVEKVVEMMSVRSSQKGLWLKWDFASEVPEMISGDPMRLRQILINLIGNAIKFTKTGGVFIKVAVEEMTAGQALILFSVHDTGIGIVEDKMESIFNAFTQQDSSITRQYGGSGLGLAISQRLAEVMGGGCWVTSRLNEGSVFYFTARFIVPKMVTNEYSSAIVGIVGKRVLFISGEDEEQRILKEVLSTSGAIVTLLANQGLMITELTKGLGTNAPYSLVIIAPEKQNHDSLELAEELRRHNAFITLPLLLICDHHTPKGVARANLLGAAYLPRPLSRTQMLEAIAGVLVKTAAAQPPSGQTVRKPFTAARILLVDDALDNRVLMEAFLKGPSYEVVMAENGQEGLEQFQSGNFDMVLMDLQMPVMDGYAATQAIRQWEKSNNNKPTPIIALSALAFNEDIKKCLDCGCTTYLAKPVKKSQLTAVISRFLSS